MAASQEVDRDRSKYAVNNFADDDIYTMYEPYATVKVNEPDGRKVKGTIHWVDANNCVDAEVRLYDRLFTVEDPASVSDEEFPSVINENSLVVLKDCLIEETIKDVAPESSFQFMREMVLLVDWINICGERYVHYLENGLMKVKSLIQFQLMFQG